MTAYILSIAGAVLLSAVVTILSPNGKMGKFVKGTMKLLILIVMLSPVVSWLSDQNYSFDTSVIGTDTGYLERCAAMLERDDEREIAIYLSDSFSVSGDVEVTRAAESGFPIKKISVKINDFGIIGQDGHIDIMSRIQEAIEEKYGCEAVVA